MPHYLQPRSDKLYWFDNAIQLPNGIMCYRHRTMFVQWSTKQNDSYLTSRGCPVCVGLIRAEVQRNISMAALGRSGSLHSLRIKEGRIK
jgi:hypothetical protein